MINSDAPFGLADGVVFYSVELDAFVASRINTDGSRDIAGQAVFPADALGAARAHLEKLGCNSIVRL